MGQDTDLSQKVFNHKPELWGIPFPPSTRRHPMKKKLIVINFIEKVTIARECVFSKYSRH